MIFFRDLEGWSYFVKAVKISLQYEIPEDQLEELKILLEKFCSYYERFILLFIFILF